jgi:hypothetical protein
LDMHSGICSSQATIEIYFDWFSNDL